MRAIQFASAPALNTLPAPASTTARSVAILARAAGPGRQLGDHLVVERVANVRTVERQVLDRARASHFR